MPFLYCTILLLPVQLNVLSHAAALNFPHQKFIFPKKRHPRQKDVLLNKNKIHKAVRKQNSFPQSAFIIPKDYYPRQI